jgi:hypothetical protein
MPLRLNAKASRNGRVHITINLAHKNLYLTCTSIFLAQVRQQKLQPFVVKMNF